MSNMKMENLRTHRTGGEASSGNISNEVVLDGVVAAGESGFTLIEVMIAAFILTVGLMAMGAVQMVSMRSGGNAFMRTQASIAAADMADRLRANIAGVNAGDYAAIGPAIPADPDCTVNNCSAALMAQEDAFQWLTSLTRTRGLARAMGTVACPLGGGICTITVMWDGRHNGAAGTGCNPANPADLICYQVAFRP